MPDRQPLVAEEDGIAAVAEADVENPFAGKRLAESESRITGEKGADHEFRGVDPAAGALGVILLVTDVNVAVLIVHEFP